jgi:hypothetical protein
LQDSKGQPNTPLNPLTLNIAQQLNSGRAHPLRRRNQPRAIRRLSSRQASHHGQEEKDCAR